MLYNELQSYCSLVKKLKTLSPNSKEYKRTFAELRLSVGRFAIKDIKCAKKGDSLYPLKKRYYFRVLLSVFLITIAAIILASIIIIYGDIDTTSKENVFLCIMLGVSLLLSFAAFGVACTVQILTDEYLNKALKEFDSKQNNSPDT